jgi:hypothetical protein
MTFAIIIFIAFLGLLLYYLLSHQPPTDLVFTSSSQDEIDILKKYLTSKGIKTYIKNKDIRHLNEMSSDLTDPSLHVADTKDYTRAIELIKSHKRIE